MLLFDIEKQDVHCGGSGCGCSASVLCGYLLRGMRDGQMEAHHLRADGRAALPHDDISGREHPRHLPRGHILESQGGISGGLSERLSLRRHPLRHRTDSHRQNTPHARAYPDGLCRLRRFTDGHRRLRAHRQMGRRGRDRAADSALATRSPRAWKRPFRSRGGSA